MKRLIKILFLLLNFVLFYAIAMEKQCSKLYKFFGIQQIQNLNSELKNLIAYEYSQWWYNLATIENLMQVGSIKFNLKGDKVLIGTFDGIVFQAKLFDLLGNFIGNLPLDNVSGYLDLTSFDFQDQYIITAYRPYDTEISIIKLFDLNFNLIKVLQIEGKILALAFNLQGQIVTIVQSFQGDFSVQCYDTNFNIIKKINKECQNVCYYAKLNRQADKVLLQFTKDFILTKSKKKYESDCIKYLAIKWNFNEEDSLNEISFDFQDKTLISSVAFSPQWDRVLTGYSDGITKLWNFNGNCLATFKHVDDSFRASNFIEIDQARLLQLYLPMVDIVEFSPDSISVLTVASYCKSAKLWNLDGKNIVVFEHEEPITNIAFSPEGNLLVIGSFNKARLWALYKNPTLEQILLRKLIHLYLITKKPSLKIQTPEMLFNCIVNCFKKPDFEFDYQELMHIWSSMPEQVRNSFWKSIIDTIKKFGK